MSQAAFEPQVICVKTPIHAAPSRPLFGNLNSIFHGFVWFHRATGVQIAMLCGRCYLHSVQIITPCFSRFLAESLFDITKVHVSYERSSAARLSWKDVNVRVSVCVCVWRTNTQSRTLERRMWQKKEKDSDKREWATLERAEGKEKGEERNADRELKKSDCTMVCPRQMVGCWGMKEKEAVGNDVSLSSFQAERNYQTSISSFGESNRCTVYSLINPAVLWSCIIKPCFHYLHCRHYYDHWNRVTVRPGCCEDSEALIFCFGPLSLSVS